MHCVHEAWVNCIELALHIMNYIIEVKWKSNMLYSHFFLFFCLSTILTSFLKFNFVPVSCVTDEVAGVIVQPTVG